MPSALSARICRRFFQLQCSGIPSQSNRSKDPPFINSRTVKIYPSSVRPHPKNSTRRRCRTLRKNLISLSSTNEISSEKNISLIATFLWIVCVCVCCRYINVCRYTNIWKKVLKHHIERRTISREENQATPDQLHQLQAYDRDSPH